MDGETAERERRDARTAVRVELRRRLALVDGELARRAAWTRDPHRATAEQQQPRASIEELNAVRAALAEELERAKGTTLA